ncbi:DUF5719 family protein [Streptomyces sp. NPDC059578]|uniref:DUF5719 family protein n=1 Tax=unclassified Streptomyces TaxID=2593676 RepID=UPI00365E0230
MNRTTLSLFAVTAALAAVTGLAVVSVPEEAGADGAPAAARLPVERSGVLCPAPSDSDLADTVYSSFTPKSEGTAATGKARLTPAEKKSTGSDEPKGTKGTKGTGKDGKGAKNGNDTAPVLVPKEPGVQVTGEESGADAPALIGAAEGDLAPGWTVQQTTTVSAGQGRGVLGLACAAPDTDFWLPGVSTAEDRTDYLHLTNPDDAAAVVDIELHGKDGPLKTSLGDGIQVQPRASVPVLLSTLTEKPQADLTAHVTVRSGRVAAAVRATDARRGSDWLAPAADPGPALVVPGIPKDVTSARLIVFAPGESDAEVDVKVASPNGPITPAGNESLHVKSGMTAVVDLGDVTKGEAGSLLLTPKGRSAAPVVAALQVVRGKGDRQETAYIPASTAVGARATVADNRAKGTALSLVAPGAAAKVRVTASAGSGGGEAVTETYTVKSGSTLLADPPVPRGLKGTYALTVESISGGPVHASRMLEAPDDGVPMFTVQALADDRGTVSVPDADQDLSVLQD